MYIYLTIDQFEILEDVLCEIEEYRVYEEENYERLQELKKIFSYKELKKLRKEEQNEI